MNAAFDERMMRQALALAEKGVGWTSPNPMVGAVVCQGTQVISEGYHPKVGDPHAERIALDRAREFARGGTLYVTLEPCSHTGRTPPCLDRVLESGIARVVIALRDPNPLVDGRSIEILRESGIEVTVGVCEQEARRLNYPFLSQVVRKRPWVTLKYAMTLDGRIATSGGDSKWISGPASREIVHDLRRRRRGILIGYRTAVKDDPLLSCRVDCTPPPRQPVRIVLGGEEPLKPDSQLLATARDIPVLRFVSSKSALRGFDGLAEILPLSTGADGTLSLPDLLAELSRREVDSVLVEGGARVLSAFLSAGLADEVYAFVAPKILNDAGALSPFIGTESRPLISAASRLTSVSVREVDGDALIHGYLSEI